MALEATFIGPDFIGQLAERQLQNGFETDATVLRANAQAWHAEQARIAQLERDNMQLSDRLASIRTAVAVA